MAALALLFAIHSYQPSPFFVLDEVDAALDNTNVARIANYIHDHAAPGMQFIVISLKTGLFQNSEALVGIYRDQAENSSKSLTLDVSASFPLTRSMVLASLECLLTFFPLIAAAQISMIALIAVWNVFNAVCRLVNAQLVSALVSCRLQSHLARLWASVIYLFLAMGWIDYGMANLIIYPDLCCLCLE